VRSKKKIYFNAEDDLMLRSKRSFVFLNLFIFLYINLLLKIIGIAN